MDKWLKTVSLRRSHESNMTANSKSTHFSPPEASSSTHKHKPLEYFQRKLSDLSASRGHIMSFSEVKIKAVEASYKVSLRRATAGKPHTIGQSLLLPAAKDVASSVLGEKVAEELESIPLSNETESRRI
jgi:hypothetical protein